MPKKQGINLNIDLDEFHSGYYQPTFLMLGKNPKRKQVGPHTVAFRKVGSIEIGLVDQIFEAMSQKNFSSQVLKTRYEEYEDDDGYVGTDGVFVQDFS